MKRITRPLDDALAALVDQLLDEGKTEGEPHDGNISFQQYGRTIQSLHQYSRQGLPTQETRQRIYNRLLPGWRKYQSEVAGKTKNRQIRHLVIYGLSAVIIITVFTTTLLVPDFYTNLQGTAVKVHPAIYITSLSLIVVGIVIWILINNIKRRRKK